jgi:hypothetical protein
VIKTQKSSFNLFDLGLENAQYFKNYADLCLKIVRMEMIIFPCVCLHSRECRDRKHFLFHKVRTPFRRAHPHSLLTPERPNSTLDFNR